LCIAPNHRPSVHLKILQLSQLSRGLPNRSLHLYAHNSSYELNAEIAADSSNDVAHMRLGNVASAVNFTAGGFFLGLRRCNDLKSQRVF
jgi:hypothetical protein